MMNTFIEPYHWYQYMIPKNWSKSFSNISFSLLLLPTSGYISQSHAALGNWARTITKAFSPKKNTYSTELFSLMGALAVSTESLASIVVHFEPTKDTVNAASHHTIHASLKELLYAVRDPQLLRATLRNKVFDMATLNAIDTQGLLSTPPSQGLRPLAYAAATQAPVDVFAQLVAAGAQPDYCEPQPAESSCDCFSWMNKKKASLKSRSARNQIRELLQQQSEKNEYAHYLVGILTSLPTQNQGQQERRILVQTNS